MRRFPGKCGRVCAVCVHESFHSSQHFDVNFMAITNSSPRNQRPSGPTIEAALRQLFLDGTNPSDGVPPDINDPPLLPADVFAAAGHLLEASGAYNILSPITLTRKSVMATG